MFELFFHGSWNELSWCEWNVNPYLCILITAVTLLLTNILADVCTEKTLNSLSKSQIIDLFLEIQKFKANIMTFLAEEIRELNPAFKSQTLSWGWGLSRWGFEASVKRCCIQKIDDGLVKQVASIERQFWTNAQHSCGECVETMVVPPLIDHSQFEQTVYKVLQHISVEITGEGTESCHGLNRKGNQATSNLPEGKTVSIILISLRLKTQFCFWIKYWFPINFNENNKSLICHHKTNTMVFIAIKRNNIFLSGCCCFVCESLCSFNFINLWLILCFILWLCLCYNRKSCKRN